MKRRKNVYLVGDFETTVYDGQTDTEVWASAVVGLGSEEVQIFHSIEDTLNFFIHDIVDKNIICYYHNLKFDGSFWLNYLLKNKKFKQAYKIIKDEKGNDKYVFDDEKDMPNNSFKYLISENGQWYHIIIKTHGKTIELRDSLKLIPLSVREMGKAFQTKHRKLEMEYTGKRYSGCEITDEEKEYIKNDVLVVKECLEEMFAENHKSITIGSCCLKEFKRNFEKVEWEYYFPDLREVKLDPNVYGTDNAEKYVRRSYRGGWCYVVKGKENKMYHNGCTADVNSLYPSVMSKESHNPYPIGMPTFWKGNYIPTLPPDKFYFVRIKTRFYLRPKMLPFVQVKNTYLYKGDEMLETSDIIDKNGKHYTTYRDNNGNIKNTTIELTLTMTDFKLLQEHYDLIDFEILDGCYFDTAIGLFNIYINKYKKIKMNSEGGRRTIAKLFLNNLYGKLASSDDSAFQVAYLNEDNLLRFRTQNAHDKPVGYIPIGSAITSYAREFTIRTAQANYHGKDKPGFIYADTDSIHCDIPETELKNVKIHDSDFLCWKIETNWDKAIFVRAKTYIEHIVKENMKPIKNPYYNIKCASMGKKSKDLLNLNLQGYFPETEEERKKFTEREIEFLKTKREMTDFKVGLVIPSTLKARQIEGGVVLYDNDFTMRD